MNPLGIRYESSFAWSPSAFVAALIALSVASVFPERSEFEVHVAFLVESGFACSGVAGIS